MKIDIFGIQFDAITLETAIKRGGELATEEGLSYVVTPNPEIVNLAREDGDYAQILNKAALVLPDGVGILHAGRMLKTPFPERVPGIDCASGLWGEIAQTGARLYLFGAKPGVAAEAGKRLAEQYPGLVVCGTSDGYFQDAADKAEEIAAAKPDVVFVCLGAPKQERFIRDYGERIGAKLMVGLGGALDVFSGEVQRAPEFWQKIGMEWAYRLACQPSRIGRMAKLPLFLVDVWRSKGKEASK